MDSALPIQPQEVVIDVTSWLILSIFSVREGLSKHDVRSKDSSFEHTVFFVKECLLDLFQGTRSFLEQTLPDNRETIHEALAAFTETYGKIKLIDVYHDFQSTYKAIAQKVFWGKLFIFLYAHLLDKLKLQDNKTYVTPEVLYAAYLQSLTLTQPEAAVFREVDLFPQYLIPIPEPTLKTYRLISICSYE